MRGVGLIFDGTVRTRTSLLFVNIFNSFIYIILNKKLIVSSTSRLIPSCFSVYRIQRIIIFYFTEKKNDGDLRLRRYFVLVQRLSLTANV